MSTGNRRGIRLGVFLAQLGAATVAAAAEGEGSLFSGDLGNAVWTLVIFVLVIVVLGKFAWGPLLSTLQQRERFIREALEKARRDRQESEALLAEYAEKLHQAKTEATGIVEEGRRDAEAVKRQIEEQARRESDNMVVRAKREIEIAKQTAIKELYAKSAFLATDLASRIIGREIRAEDHERLIQEAIDEVGRMESN